MRICLGIVEVFPIYGFSDGYIIFILDLFEKSPFKRFSH